MRQDILNSSIGDYFIMYGVDLTLFDTQVTTQESLSDEMKTYYSNYLIDNAKAVLVHDQFAQKHPIPQNKGKTIEFRKYAPLAKALTPLVEGVTPSGNSLSVSTITATIKQYGDYIRMSDMLQMTAIDNNLVQASELLGMQAGETLDTITREVLNSGTNVQFAFGQVTSRHLLVGGDSTAANNHYLSVDCARLAHRNLKTYKARPVSGTDFVGIIHPDVSFDLKGDEKWEKIKDYDPKDLYVGEIGKIHGIRWIETTEAKVFTADDLTAASRNLTVASLSSKTFTVDEAISAAEAAALVGRSILINGYKYTVASSAAGVAGAATVTISETVVGTPADGDIIYPGEAGAKGRPVYSTVVLGRDGYGTTELEGGGLEFIVKQLGSGDDPLNQRSTSGWKATKTAELLVNEYVLRIETTSTFEGLAN